MEVAIITEDSLIELIQAFLLAISLIFCTFYAIKSRFNIARSFWIGSVLVFLSAIRRELSFLSDILVPEGFLLLGASYEWWEDAVLFLIAVTALGLLTYAWHYVSAVLKQVPTALYIVIFLLVILQYVAENEIGFSAISGNIVEELCELIIYTITFMYLWRFKLDDFNTRFIKQTNPLDLRYNFLPPSQNKNNS
ncbi:hypothetical protein [Psychrobacter phenylpyruvicus]|uniref:Uncharacterized protein n=1 Tax=Psychrobacter phenylpyruvicus TaxID=29432 RepID=A0A379LJG4_9GAMM|nr:hypothetical protein [Psychrobacter phenylpyruvicus]SUD89902.1 Uncharacterised protein [Psychrobacter phenylpyruvicus]